MRILLLVFILLISHSVKAEGLKQLSDTKALSDKIMQNFVKEEFKNGIGNAKKYWPLPEVELDSLTNTINNQWVIVRQRYGRTTGSEFVKQEKIGKSFIRYFYLHKFDNHAIYWKFVYYKPKNEWIINEISFRDEIDFMFE